MMDGYTFFKGPWHNVEWLIEFTEAFYAEHVVPKGLGDRFQLAAAKIMVRRRWEPAKLLIKDHLEPVLRELGIFYVPNRIQPGPGVVFPIQNLEGRPTHGKLNPFYELSLGSGLAKYAALGRKESFVGPAWFGLSDRVFREIRRTRSAVIAEGLYDLLASRVLIPSAPVLSTGTKTLSDEHVQYLQMLGVQNVYLMFDNESGKQKGELSEEVGPKEGAGNQAMRVLKAVYSKKTKLNFETIFTPADDASACLESFDTALRLRSLLARFAA